MEDLHYDEAAEEDAIDDNVSTSSRRVGTRQGSVGVEDIQRVIRGGRRKGKPGRVSGTYLCCWHFFTQQSIGVMFCH
jgi:hypothetical protein